MSRKKQSGLFDDKAYVGAKVSTEDHRRWRDKNRPHVRAKNRARAKTRNAYMREWRKNNRDKMTASARIRTLKKYGLTPESYGQLVIDQENRCAICRRSASSFKPKHKKHKHAKLDIDHCHASGKVRALLCYNCNAILGHAGDSIQVLQRAIDYLKKHGVK